MSKQLTKYELLLISRLLDEAAGEFSNHTCNDLFLTNNEENRDLLIKVAKDDLKGEDLEEEIDTILSAKGKEICTNDWQLMYYLSKRCKEAAKKGK